MKIPALNGLKKEPDRDKIRKNLGDRPSYVFSTDSQSNSLGKVAIYIDSLRGYGVDKVLLKAVISTSKFN